MGVIRLTIAYDGTPFAGWAAQPGRRTVQGELEAALARILGEPAALTVAGRTDAGVHAWGQVASFALAQRSPRARDRGARCRPRSGRLRRPPRRPLSHLLLLGRRRAGPEPVRTRAGAVVAAPARPRGARSLRRGAARGPRLHRLHPDR